MKVILKQTLPKVGKEGTVVSVKPGFARNFLFPNGMAILADKTQVKALEARLARQNAKLEETKAGAQANAEKLSGMRVLVGTKSGEDGRLFGAITSADIASAVTAASGVAIDKKQVPMLQPIKRTGIYKVELDLHRMVDCSVSVVVYDPERGLPDAPVAEVEEEEPADDYDE